MSDKIKEYDEEGRVIRENRSAIKRERDSIRTFAEELLKLPSHQYPLLPISEALIAALKEGKRLTGNALRRHLNYLVRLLDEHDLEKLQQMHEHINHPYLHDPQKNRRIQQEIDRLLANDSNIYGELFTHYADLDMQYVRQMVREAQKQISEAAAEAAENHAEPDNENSTKTAPKADKYRRRLQKYLQNLALNYVEDEDFDSTSGN